MNFFELAVPMVAAIAAIAAIPFYLCYYVESVLSLSKTGRNSH